MAAEGAGLTAVSSLEDPVRARLYRIVAESDAPVGRDEAAAAAGIGRPLAAYHLDKLADLGLLTASYQRPEGRGGPGAGRPAKVYARSDREFAVSVPPREYELAARLLAVAVEADAGGPAWAALHDAAWQFGCNLGRRAGVVEPGVVEPGAVEPGAADQARKQAVLEAVLRDHGFEPWHDENGTVRLRNCPFHSLATVHPHLVCGMNLAIMQGLVEGLGADGLNPELSPPQGRCCVVLAATQQTGET
jgi:predicted ArsR family transcriptional regulator